MIQSPLMRAATVLKIALAVIAVAAVLALLRLLPIGEWLTDFQAYVRNLGPIGYVVYALGYGVVALVIPASVLTLGAGAIFGVLAGSIVVAVGATIAATLAFLLARTVLRKRIEAMTARNPKFVAVDRAIAKEGAKIVFLVRLAAVFPFIFMNYAFGLTGIRLLPYIGATITGILPATIAFVYLGAAGAAVATQSRAKAVVTIAGAVLALIASAYVARVATRAIRKAGVDERADATPADPIPTE